MKTPIKLLPTDLIAVEVPRDAIKWKIETLPEEEDLQQMTILMFDTLDYIRLPLEKYEILGEVTEDEIKVDFNKFPEVSLTGEEARLLLDHNDNINLRKLLKASGLNWVNEISEPSRSYSGFTSEQIELDKYYWEEVRIFQEAESKLIKGKLIILKIK